MNCTTQHARFSVVDRRGPGRSVNSNGLPRIVGPTAPCHLKNHRFFPFHSTLFQSAGRYFPASKETAAAFFVATDHGGVDHSRRSRIGRCR